MRNLEHKQRGVAHTNTHAKVLPLAITFGDFGTTGGGLGGLYVVLGTFLAAATGGSRFHMSLNSCQYQKLFISHIFII